MTSRKFGQFWPPLPPTPCILEALVTSSQNHWPLPLWPSCFSIWQYSTIQNTPFLGFCISSQILILSFVYICQSYTLYVIIVFFKTNIWMNWLGVVHKRRHGLRGGGGKGFFDDSTKALVIKPVTMGGGGSKIFQNCVTSFIDDPLLVQEWGSKPHIGAIFTCQQKLKMNKFGAYKTAVLKLVLNRSADFPWNTHSPLFY